MEKSRQAGSMPVMALARLWVAELWRRPRLWLSLAAGKLERRLKTRRWGLLVGLVLAMALLVALVVTELVPNWLAVPLALLSPLVLWAFHVRNRVFVENFVDFTKEDAKAVSGLSTLLTTELGRLRELYQQSSDLSIPTAVGVESQGGFGRAKEAGVFLSISADEATDMLEGAVPADAGINLGGTKVPLKPLLTFINRINRGPRLTGSVHLTEAGGGPTITAQLLGKGQIRTWRINEPREPVSPEQRKAFLDTMVRELACQMFSQLVLPGSIRWKAVEAFNEYLELYDQVRRTQRDRGQLLKEAQGKLLEAIAWDDQFDLGYYNLGVINTKLAHTERVAEQETEDATSCADFDRSELDAGRREAARLAFERALTKNPDRWEAYHALAVIRFSEIDPVAPEDPLPEGEKQDELLKAIALCDQALAIAKEREQSLSALYDLRGMAQTRLGESFRAATRSHWRAVSRSWAEYCRARRRSAARPDGLPDLVAHARDNATAALHGLASAYERRALVGRRRSPSGQRTAADVDGLPPKLSPGNRLHLMAARRIFRKAARLAGDGSAATAAARFELGGTYEAARRYRPARKCGKAAEHYELAARVHPRSAEYRARWAKALAGQRRAAPRRGASPQKLEALKHEAERQASQALDLLAEPFSVAVLPFRAEALGLRCEATLNALEATFRRLEDSEQEQRVREIRALGETIESTLFAEDPETKKRTKAADPLKAAASLQGRRASLTRRSEQPLPEGAVANWWAWQLDQVELAMGRLYAEAGIEHPGAWPNALDVLESLYRRFGKSEHQKGRLVEFGIYSQLARALRECGDGNYVKALRVAAEGVRRSPLDVEARREAGRAHFALEQFSDALDAWKQALALSPSDPYLHYELAMCHRRIAGGETDEEKRQRSLEKAEANFGKARELFDGEDLDGEAWARFWCGKTALEAGEPTKALAHLQGAEHGTATAAAALLLGEAHLRLEQRPAADHAFQRCAEALADEEKMKKLPGRDTIDGLWGDELPLAAVEARIARGMAEAKFLQAGDWQSRQRALCAQLLLARAKSCLGDLGPEHAGARDEATKQIIETEGRILEAYGAIGEALRLAGERLRYEDTPETRRAEAELLELNAKLGPWLDDAALLRLAAKHLQANEAGPVGSARN